jgi:hypothetical protein
LKFFLEVPELRNLDFTLPIEKNDLGLCIQRIAQIPVSRIFFQKYGEGWGSREKKRR